jgi:catechol 2,3-dioxygenase-like lactoylglutathione lyase family enzyme
MSTKILGLRTVIYPVSNLAESKAYWVKLLGIEPYFDQPFYVGFEVGGYELGLLPDANPEDGSTTYWGVANVQEAMAEAISLGAAEYVPATEVGDGITTGTVRLPDGSLVGFIENPHFELG